MTIAWEATLLGILIGLLASLTPAELFLSWLVAMWIIHRNPH